MIADGGCLGEAVLPDEYHRGFRLRLPAHLPPSSIFLSPDSSMGPGTVGDSPWGLTYYLYAYINHVSPTSLSSSLSTALTAPFAPYNSYSGSDRKSSKVFLSFTKSLINDPETILSERQAPAQSVGKTLMPSSKPISLDAALERPFYYANETMAVHVKLDNPRAASLGGLRITLKQLVTTRCINEAKHVTKVPLAVYEFPCVDANGCFVGSTSTRSSLGGGCQLKEYPFVIDTVRVQLKAAGHFLRQVAVESRLPRTAIRELLLAPSFEQSYDFGNTNLRYFSIQYYMNVHVIVPWGANLIAKLPFTVASRGATESLYNVDNLTSLCSSSVSQPQPQPQPQQRSRDQFDDLDDEDLNRARSAFSATTAAVSDSAEQRLAELHQAIQVFPKERLWREFDASLRLLDVLKTLASSSAAAAAVPLRQGNDALEAFESSRRTWTRELAEAGNEIKDKIDLLAGLVCIADPAALAAGVEQSRGLGTMPSAMHASVPKDLVDAVKTCFMPAYFKLVACHAQAEHRDAMAEALNLLLDTLELVYMKFHLALPQPSTCATTTGAVVEVDADFSGSQLLSLIRGRLTRDFTRLILVIPGLVEWRWLLEGLLAGALQDGGGWSSDAPLELSDGLLYAAEPDCSDTPAELNYRLAAAFQSIHDRLSQSFADARIAADEIVHYGRLLAALLRTKAPRQAATIAAAHYAYFKAGLFVYFGSFGQLMLPFDGAVRPRIGPVGGDLKALREELVPLRASLIMSMQQS